MYWRLFRLRVCLIGWWWHSWWCSNTLTNDEWRELYEDEGDAGAEYCYVEGWCRD